ncbi:MAG TPA: SDR family oxidoreductase [Terriglobales bacterium]|nr:SDR family oxidoreductase [Terriglobales bacterium]
MNLQLDNKVILITGGAKGIGAEIARTVCEEGATAVIADKDSDAGVKIESELMHVKQKAKFLQADLTLTDATRALIDATLNAYGRIDALVNNAGVNDRIGLENGSPESYRDSLRRNLFHYYDMAHYALPSLKESHGSILNIASKTAITGQGGTSGYASSKGAILALTREWAVELLPYGIRVNSIVPAEVMTPLYRQWLSTFPDPETKLRDIVSKIPLGKRMTEAAEIAAVAVFLISEKAAHITGQHIFVDGGYVHLDRALT